MFPISCAPEAHLHLRTHAPPFILSVVCLSALAADPPPADVSTDTPPAQSPAPADADSAPRLGPIGQIFNDLHRALGGRKSPPAAQTDLATQASQPFQLIPPSSHLLGDWFGLLPTLESKGITPSISFVTNLAGNVSGGMRQGFTEADNADFQFYFDLDKILGIPGATFDLDMSQRSGSSLTRDYIGNIFNVQQVFGGSTFRLVDAAWQQKLFGDRLSLRLGRISAGDDFLVSEYDYLFMQNAFDGNPVGIFFNSPGMTAYPNATWGALAKLKILDQLSLMGGIYNGDPQIRSNACHGVNFSMNGPLFAMAELAYQLNQQTGDTGLVGNYKIGFWYDNSVYADFNGGTSRGNWGFYALFDQQILAFGDSQPHSQRGLGVFGSLLVSPDQSISTLPWFFTAGVAARGLLESRPDDVAGFGAAFGSFSGDLQNAQRQAQLLNPAAGVQTNETALELTYRINLRNAAVYIQPDLQYIIRPGGTGQIENALVLGCQIGINF